MKKFITLILIFIAFVGFGQIPFKETADPIKVKVSADALPNSIYEGLDGVLYYKSATDTFRIDNGNVATVLTSNTTISKSGVYELNSSGGSFTVTLADVPNIEVEFRNSSNTLSTNAVSIAVANTANTVNDNSGTFATSNFPVNLNLDNNISKFSRVEGDANSWYLSTETKVTVPQTWVDNGFVTPNGSGVVATPDLSLVANQTDGTSIYVYRVGAAGVLFDGTTDYNVSVGDRVWRTGASWFVETNSTTVQVVSQDAAPSPANVFIADIVYDTLGVDTQYVWNNTSYVRFEAGGLGTQSQKISKVECYQDEQGGSSEEYNTLELTWATNTSRVAGGPVYAQISPSSTFNLSAIEFLIYTGGASTGTIEVRDGASATDPIIATSSVESAIDNQVTRFEFASNSTLTSGNTYTITWQFGADNANIRWIITNTGDNVAEVRNSNTTSDPLIAVYSVAPASYDVFTLEDGTQYAFDETNTEINISGGLPVGWTPCATEGLRGTPVADNATLTALPARDYERRKVLADGKEYVFELGAVSGTLADDGATGFWQEQITEDLETLLVEGSTSTQTASESFSLPNGQTWNDLANTYEKVYVSVRDAGLSTNPVSATYRVDDLITHGKGALSVSYFGTTNYSIEITGIAGTGTSFSVSNNTNSHSSFRMWGIKAQKTVINTTDVPVNMTGVQNGYLLVYNATTGTFEAQAPDPHTDSELRIISNSNVYNVAPITQVNLQAAYDGISGNNASNTVPAEVITAAAALNTTSYKIYLGHDIWYYTAVQNPSSASDWTVFGGGGKDDFGVSIPTGNIFTFK